MRKLRSCHTTVEEFLRGSAPIEFSAAGNTRRTKVAVVPVASAAAIDRGVVMKGIVFTEFLEMVEVRFSADMVDDIIDDANLPSGGAYTAVGTYPHTEMVALAGALSQRSGMAVPDLLLTFGEHLFGCFVKNYPAFFTGASDAFLFLSGIENIIHTEVRKLYPNAELPRFEVEQHDAQRLVLVYDSRRHFEDLADGLMHGCIAHFGGGISIARETLGEGDARRERFILTRTA